MVGCVFLTGRDLVDILHLFSFHGVPAWVLVQVVVVAKIFLGLCLGKTAQVSLATVLPLADGGIPMLMTGVVNILLPPLHMCCRFLALGVVVSARPNSSVPST